MQLDCCHCLLPFYRFLSSVVIQSFAKQVPKTDNYWWIYIFYIKQNVNKLHSVVGMSKSAKDASSWVMQWSMSWLALQWQGAKKEFCIIKIFLSYELCTKTTRMSILFTIVWCRDRYLNAVLNYAYKRHYCSRDNGYHS